MDLDIPEGRPEGGARVGRDGRDRPTEGPPLDDAPPILLLSDIDLEKFSLGESDDVGEGEGGLCIEGFRDWVTDGRFADGALGPASVCVQE